VSENTKAANGLHRRLVVRNDKGEILLGISFGLDGDGNPFLDNASAGGREGVPEVGKPGNGRVYIDMTDKATQTNEIFKTTTAEDALIIEYMKSLVDKTAPYNAVCNSCRDFSREEFKTVKDWITRLRNPLPTQVAPYHAP
jgi:hypothetical protein